MYSFQAIEMDQVDLEEYYDFKDKLIFTTMEWLNYMKINQNAAPLIIRITNNNDFVGYFTGFLFSKYLIKIIASPFDGWTTAYMGFDVKDDYKRADVMGPLSEFLFQTYKCQFIQITDRFIEEDDIKDSGLHYIMKTTLELKIDKSDEELLKGYTKSCRETIRQFDRRGATIEKAEPDEQFAAEYHEQLQEVFAKQNLVPTYDLSRTIDLFKSLKKDQLLCLRVRNPEGKPIASTYYVGHNGRVCFQGAASFREFQFYRPNEAMFWYAIRYFRDRGYVYADMNGERRYKEKFRPEKISYPCIMMARYPVLIRLRDAAKKIVWVGIRLKGMGKGDAVPKTTTYQNQEE